jgi:nitrogen fixation/metabolism regulation signal transduction histidine kinase
MFPHQAGVIIIIQVQLLTSSSPSSSDLTRIFLTLGITSELLGVMLIVFFTRCSKYQSRESPGSAAIRIASELPAFFVLAGIVGVAAALVVETLEVSVGVAIVMSGVLILWIIFCFVIWCLEVDGRVVVSC